jgi:hypothetical protein
LILSHFLQIHVFLLFSAFRKVWNPHRSSNSGYNLNPPDQVEIEQQQKNMKNYHFCTIPQVFSFYFPTITKRINLKYIFVPLFSLIDHKKRIVQLHAIFFSLLFLSKFMENDRKHFSHFLCSFQFFEWEMCENCLFIKHNRFQRFSSIPETPWQSVFPFTLVL